MTALNEWSQVQQGFPPWREVAFDPIPRYIRNSRDLAEYVHFDFAYQAYLNAALILLNSGPRSLLNQKIISTLFIYFPHFFRRPRLPRFTLSS
jgi:hypothetical protein